VAGRKYSMEQKDSFFRLIDKGGTVRAAAKAAGVHPEAAYTWLRGAGLTMQRATPRKYTDADKAAFFVLLAERKNVSAVAAELGFTRVTCYAWAHKAGVFTSRERTVNPRREEFLRLRAAGLTRAEARALVAADRRSAADWDKGITAINRGRGLSRRPRRALSGADTDRREATTHHPHDRRAGPPGSGREAHPSSLPEPDRTGADQRPAPDRDVDPADRSRTGSLTVHDQPRAEAQHRVHPRIPAAHRSPAVGPAAETPAAAEAARSL
jgi:transposase-like protein